MPPLTVTRIQKGAKLSILRGLTPGDVKSRSGYISKFNLVVAKEFPIYIELKLEVGSAVKGNYGNMFIFHGPINGNTRVEVHCTCGYYLYFLEVVNAKKNIGPLYIATAEARRNYRGMSVRVEPFGVRILPLLPKQTNPKHLTYLCKHLYASSKWIISNKEFIEKKMRRVSGAMMEKKDSGEEKDLKKAETMVNKMLADLFK